jgi:hypothetical protein
MKTLMIFPTHSFVDLITNSSTELFICDTDKKVDAFKKVIIKIVKSYNALLPLSEESKYYKPIPLDNVFDGIFCEPKVCQFNFDIADYPKVQEYLDIHNYERSRRHPIKRKCRDAQDEFRDKNKCPEGDSSKWHEEYHRLGKEWADLENATESELVKWICEQNGLPWHFEAGENKERSWRYYGKYVGPKHEEESYRSLLEEFMSAVSWDYPVKKGNILLYTASDNSAPYNLFPMIEMVFSCHRRHLG